MKHKGIAAWQIILIIFIVLLVLFGLYLGLAWILRSIDTNPSSSSSPNSNQSVTKSDNFDQSLVGTWDSGCLMPDPTSKWAVEDQVVISKNGTADFTRKSYDSIDCKTTEPFNVITMKFKLETPSQGKVNLTILDNQNTMGTQGESNIGQTIYDVYQINGSNLKMAFGFRPATGGDGTSDAKRHTTVEGTTNYTKK